MGAKGKRMTTTPEAQAQIARRRQFKTLMIRMAIFSLVVAAIAAFIIGMGDDVSIHMIVATAILAGGSVMMAAVLMGLIFYSNNSGHDDAATSQTKDD